MIAPAEHTRVYLAVGATDMRKQIDGLAALVEDVLEQDPVGCQGVDVRADLAPLVAVAVQPIRPQGIERDQDDVVRPLQLRVRTRWRLATCLKEDGHRQKSPGSWP